MYVIPMLCFSDIFVLLGLVGFSLILGILEFLKYDIVSISWQDFVNDLLLQGKVCYSLLFISKNTKRS